MSPRALGRNVYTFRNRTQQVAYLGLRAGFGKTANLQFHIYDDFLYTDKRLTQGLADNFDRFFSGGGNFQLRVSPWMKFKAYSEVYTGNFQRDLFDFPDLYLVHDSLYVNTKRSGQLNGGAHTRLASDLFAYPDSTNREENAAKRRRKKFLRHPRFVAQEPGQKMYNVGRTFYVIEHDFNYKDKREWHMPVQIMGGSLGGHYNVWSQNTIHNWSLIDKINPRNFESGKLYTPGTDSDSFERLHHFYPASKVHRFMFGVAGSFSKIPNF